MIPVPYRLIETEAAYRLALARVEALMDADDDETVAELRYWAQLVDLYEQQICPRPPLEPLAYLTHTMELTGRSERDLAALIGSRPRASEVLTGRRALSKAMIRKLATVWKLDAAILLGAESTTAQAA